MNSAHRPAPTLEESWERLDSYSRELHEQALSCSADALWALRPQPCFSPDTSFEELPEEIIRQCCPHKSCGGTELMKEKSAQLRDGKAVIIYSYVRASNGDGYFSALSTEGLIEQLNDPNYWPNGH